jgi:two-component system, chemotaxis family, response regulator Rcp1
MPTKPHILHVDDSEDDRRLFEWAFNRSGIKGVLHSVSGAADAMHYLNQSGKSSNSPRPKLIVLDLSLPQFDGLELLELIRDHPSFKVIPVVILSGSDSHASMQRCRELGVDDYIVKPKTPQELAELIASLSHWLIGSSSGLPASNRRN